MSASHDDNERLLDELLADARNAPTRADLGRVESRLQEWMGPAPVPPPPPSGAYRRSSRLLKPLLVVVVGVGALALVYSEASSSRSSSPEGAARELPSAPATFTPPTSVVAPASVSVADLPEVPEGVPARPAPAAPPSTAITSARRPAPWSGSEPKSAEGRPAPTEESEASFLRRTRAALAEDPARALRMTEEHATRYPQGVLVQERDVIAIDALVRLGARDEARARAKAFQARYPASAHASRVTALVGTEAP